MNLITEFRDRNGNDILPNEPVPVVVYIEGSTMTLFSNRGDVVARADLVLDHNVPVWRVVRGRSRRYKHLGDATEVRISL